MRLRAGAVVPLVILALSASLASAQLPTLPVPVPSGNTPGPASVQLKTALTQVTVSLDKAATVELTVTNTESSTNTPGDTARFISLEVTGAPVGWTPGVSPASFQLKPGQSGKATLTVAVTGGAKDRDIKLTVTAKAWPRGVNSVPVAGPQVDPEALSTVDVAASRADTPVRTLLETVGPYIWVLLLGLVAALVVILSLVAANRRIAVRLLAPEPERAIAPGSRTEFPLVVHNITRRDDTVVLRVPDVPEGWAAFLPTPQLDLEPGRQEPVSVVIIAPKDAQDGARQSFTVCATSAQAPRRPATVVLEAEIVAAVHAPRRRKEKDA